MEKMIITFLGTGNSIPTKMRNHTSILFNYKAENILVDCGEGTQRQFKMAGLGLFKLTKILITHWHGDHFLGLPGLLQTLAILDYKKTLQIYGPVGTKNNIFLLKKLVNIPLFLEIHEVKNKKFIENSDFLIETKSMFHTKPTNAYSFIFKDKRRLDKNKLKKYYLPNSQILKKLQDGDDIIFNNKKIKASEVSYIEKGRKISVILDTAPNKNAIDLAKNSDLLIMESSFSQEEKKQAEKFRHLTLNDATIISKKAKVKNLILTHISQRYEHDLIKIEAKARKLFKNTSIAKDFDSITI